ncbi:putative FNIP repeat-containing protein [Cotonvirus japonicus]|uniref:FNIP repeat-containing protein n=1 Tax=Cotonvirus japonicus TaxID=2811091 RepID=A0ABM7NTL5_9VIRU|nr:putative FNIP repeat-containing protein [Cotonvirus japonicus]BCS83513.1 putative FNIP repeat-containing protein [Cotonvirus japonicus]
MSVSNLIITDILSNYDIMCIIDFLDDIDKINFLKSNTSLYSLIDNVVFTRIYNYDLINRVNKKFRYVKYEISDYNINQKIPDIVTHIDVNTSNIITNKFLNNIIHIHFKQEFYQNTKNLLPDNLRELIIDNYNYYQNTDVFFPKSLSYLKIINYHVPLKINTLLCNITVLDLGHYYGNITGLIPPSVKTLKINCKNFTGYFPATIETLILGDTFNSKIKARLPENLLNLKLGNQFNKSINHLPECLQTLKIGTNFNKSIKYLPHKLEKLIFGKDSKFMYSVRGILPRTLKILKFGAHFNQDIEDCFPNGLIKLEFGDIFNMPIKRKIKIRKCVPPIFKMFNIKKFLPNSLEYVKFGMYFNQSINNAIPTNMRKIILGIHYNKIISHVPKNLTYVELNMGFRFGIGKSLKNITHIKIPKTLYSYYLKDLPKHEILTNKNYSFSDSLIIKINQ